MKDQKAILFFLLKFIGFYIVVNTAYGFWINSYYPGPDPITEMVTHQSAAIISLTEDNIMVEGTTNSANVPIVQGTQRVISVFEGCNGLNVMIVFVSFIVAYSGTWKKNVIFGLIGVVLIHIANLFRVALLFFISKYYPDNLYFFHKYLFTGMLYILVFFLWYLWVKRIWPEKK